MGSKSSKKKIKKPSILSVLTIGNSMAGKTALIHRFTDNFFDEKSMSTLATDFVIVEKKFKYKKDEAKVKVKVWDSPGQERFESFVVNALKNTQGILLVYDTTARKSFEDLQMWINKVNDCQVNTSFPFILIANKIDLVDQRHVTTEECKQFAEKLKMPYFETSAKTGQGVNEAFNALLEKVFNNLINDKSVHYELKE